MAVDAFTLRYQLANEIRDIRVKARATQGEIALLTTWSTAKVSRFEAGLYPHALADVMLYLHLLDVPEARSREVMAMAREARQPAAFGRFADILTQEQIEYFEGLAHADVIQQADDLVPLLLRTSDYTHAIDRVTKSPLTMVRWYELGQRLRLDWPESQQRLLFILGETALVRLIGGTDVMHDQLMHLRRLGGRRNITIRVVPFTAGIHPGVGEAFTILTYEDTAVYVAQAQSPLKPCAIHRSVREVDFFSNCFDDLYAASLPLETLLPKALAKLAA